jgi:L-alanine-DL-glutamate epimerase-like enolase superfamily enzyme
MQRRTFLQGAAIGVGGAMLATGRGFASTAEPIVEQASRGTAPLTITDVQPIIIRAPRGDGSPAGPLVVNDLGTTTGGNGIWNRLDLASPSRFNGVEQAVLVKITTKEGLIGWGECHAPAAPRMQATIISDLFKPQLIGQDARRVEPLWHRLYASERTRGYSTGSHLEALAGVDLALWDLLGKFAGVPVYRLLGGKFRDAIPTYATFSGTYTNKEKGQAVIDRAHAMVASGFTVLKLALRQGPDSDEFATVKLIADALNGKAQIAVDALGAFSFNEAVRMGRELDRIGNIAWFEDPLVPDDLPRYPELARTIDTAICCGEMLSTRYQFRDLLMQRGADMINPDMGRAGGLTEMRRITWVADVYGALWAPHVSTGSAPYMAASMHLAVSSPNCPMMEIYDGNKQAGPFGNKLLKQPLDIKPGLATVPERPGLGVDFDPAALAALTVEVRP